MLRFQANALLSQASLMQEAKKEEDSDDDDDAEEVNLLVFLHVDCIHSQQWKCRISKPHIDIDM